MKPVQLEDFRKLVDRAGLSARSIAVALDYSPTWMYYFINGKLDTKKMNLSIWIFNQFLKEAIITGVLPTKNFAGKDLHVWLKDTFQSWLRARIEVDLMVSFDKSQEDTDLGTAMDLTLEVVDDKIAL